MRYINISATFIMIEGFFFSFLKRGEEGERVREIEPNTGPQSHEPEIMT